VPTSPDATSPNECNQYYGLHSLDEVAGEGMHTPSRETALELMMDLMPTLRGLLAEVAVHDRNLAEQAKRAATSVISNHAEADGVRQGHRRERIRTAQGSLHELRSQLKLAAAWGYVPRLEVERLDAQLDRVAALTWRRLHSPRA
jgi:four helix bundle protein